MSRSRKPRKVRQNSDLGDAEKMVAQYAVAREEEEEEDELNRDDVTSEGSKGFPREYQRMVSSATVRTIIHRCLNIIKESDESKVLEKISGVATEPGVVQ